MMVDSNSTIYSTYPGSQHFSLTGSSRPAFAPPLGDPTLTKHPHPYRNGQDDINTWQYPYNGYAPGPSGPHPFTLHSQITPADSTLSHQPIPSINIIPPQNEEIQQSSNAHQSAPTLTSLGKRKATNDPDATRASAKRRQTQPDGNRNRKQDAASDVWYHMYGTDSDGVADKSKKWFSKPPEHLYPKLGCRYCSFTTRNGNGRTKDLRIHLKKKHLNEYDTAARSKQLKALDPSCDTKSLSEPKKGIRKAVEDRSVGRFTKGEFQCLLQQWLAEDPQAFDTLSRPGFRKMLLYGTQDRLTDEDLDISAGSFDKLINDLQNSLGKISFTSDWWFIDIDGPGFFVITAHWCAEESSLGLAIRSALVAIEYMLPNEWWWETFKRVFKRLSLSPKKIAGVTGPYWSDLTLEGTLEAETTKVQVERSFIYYIYSWCDFYLRAEIKVEKKGIQCEPYETATSLHNIFDRFHTLLGELTLLHDDGYTLPLVKGLAQRYYCSWYETLRLIQGLLRMRQGLTTLYEQNPNLEQYRLNDSDWSILVDMNAYLDILRRFNIEVDVESCESGSRLFGALKGLEGQIRLFQSRKPHLKSFIDKALSRIEYVVCHGLVDWPTIRMMVLDPTIKLTFVPEFNADDDSTSRHITKLKKELIDLMRVKCQDLNHSDREPHDVEDEHRYEVERELEEYLAGGVIYNRKFNLLNFWKNSQETYPHLYRIAFDLIPFQVDHVSCKRIFSTSEHTKALLDGTISLKQFETLERIKYSSGRACLQDVVWYNLEIEDNVKGTLPGQEMLKSILRSIGKEYVQPEEEEEEEEEEDEDEEDEEDEDEEETD